jgi:membrane protease YdiL (CAAX protease family)
LRFRKNLRGIKKPARGYVFHPRRIPARLRSADENGNVYISGYGFIQTDPQEAEREAVRRVSGLAGGVLLMLLLLPGLLLIPAQLFVRYLGSFLSLSSPRELVVWTAVLEEIRTGLWTLGSYLTPILFLLFAGRRDAGRSKRPSARRRASPGISFLYILCALGVSGLVLTGGDLLNSLLQTLGILAVRSQETVPTVSAAAVLYLMRLVMTAVLEEVLLRGQLLRLCRRYGDGFAVLLTALVSGLIAGNLTGDLNGFVMALVYGCLTVRTGSLTAAIAAHLCHLLWRPLLQLAVPSDLLSNVQTAAALVLILLGLLGFALLCSLETDAFAIRSEGSGPRSRFTFRGKLGIALSNAFFSASAVLWLLQAAQKMVIL